MIFDFRFTILDLCDAIFNFFYRHLLYKRTTAYRKLFPDGKFLDPETPYPSEVKLILKAIKRPDYQLSECDMGIVLSQLIQSDINYADAQEICAIINRDYANEWHYMTRRNIIEMQLDDFKKKQKEKQEKEQEEAQEDVPVK